MQKGSLNIIIALVIGSVIIGGGFLIWRSQQNNLEIESVEELSPDTLVTGQPGFFGDSNFNNNIVTDENPTQAPPPPPETTSDVTGSIDSETLVLPPPPPPPPRF